MENHLKNFSFSSRTLRNEIPFSFSSRNWRIFFQISLSLLDWTFLPLVAQWHIRSLDKGQRQHTNKDIKMSGFLKEWRCVEQGIVPCSFAAMLPMIEKLLGWKKENYLKRFDPEILKEASTVHSPSWLKKASASVCRRWIQTWLVGLVGGGRPERKLGLPF